MKVLYCEAIASAIRRALTEDNWKFTFQEENGTFRFGYCPGGAIRSLRYLILVHDSDFNVYCQLPIGIDPEDEDLMDRMGSFLFRINNDLRMGHFELDPAKGEIRYKTFVDCEGLEAPTKDMIINSIYGAFVAVGQFEAGIGALAFGDCTVREAIALCKSSRKWLSFYDQLPEDEENRGEDDDRDLGCFPDLEDFDGEEEPEDEGDILDLSQLSEEELAQLETDF